MTKKTLLVALALYVVSSLVSYGALSFSNRNQVVLPVCEGEGCVQDETALGSLLKIDPKEPKDQACPLNGKYFTKTEQAAWQKRRPLAVMIENAPDARPQSGLNNADIVFEAVAEGGVTRFMALVYCDAQANDVELAPIRSARTYFVDWASGFNLPMYVHVGGANMPGPSDALGQIADYGWNGQNDINQFSVGYPTFVRDYNRVPGKEIATEHTMVTSTEKLWAVAEKRKWTNMSPDRTVARKVVPGTDWKDGYTGWTFSDAKSSAPGAVREISHEFWTGYQQYAVRWVFNPTTATYQRFMAGEPHVDMNTDQQIEAANVVVLLTTEKGPINEKKHMLYGTTGTGKALVFKNGTVTEATWNKKTRESELLFSDDKGKPVVFERGLTWISVLSSTAEVQY